MSKGGVGQGLGGVQHAEECQVSYWVFFFPYYQPAPVPHWNDFFLINLPNWCKTTTIFHFFQWIENWIFWNSILRRQVSTGKIRCWNFQCAKEEKGAKLNSCESKTQQTTRGIYRADRPTLQQWFLKKKKKKDFGVLAGRKPKTGDCEMSLPPKKQMQVQAAFKILLL